MAGEYLPSYAEWQAAGSSNNAEVINKILHSNKYVDIKNVAYCDLHQNKDVLARLVYSKNPFAKALALAPYNYESLPQSIRDDLNIVRRPDLDARPRVGTDWILCPASEERMSEALEDSATMIYGGLMIKLRGRLAALCYRSFSTENGTFIEGNFYSPDSDTQLSLKKQFIDATVLPKLSDSNWFLIRSVSDTNNKGDIIMDRVLDKSRQMPPFIPDNVHGYQSREEYLDKRKENYPNTNAGI